MALSLKSVGRLAEGRSHKFNRPTLPQRPAHSNSVGRTVSCSAESRNVIRPPLLSVNLWQRYCMSLETNPFLTKACTSLVGFMLGDLLAQHLEGSATVDAARVLRLGAYGFMLDGPVGHLWYKWLDGTVDSTFTNSKGTAAIATKTAADQLIWAPVMTCAFFAFLHLLEGQPDLILPTIQTKVLPTVAANYVIWPAAHVISFKYVPSHQRILYNNVIAIFWNCYLSIVAAGAGGAGAVGDVMQSADLVSLSEVAARVQDTLPFGGFWLQDVLQVSAQSALKMAGSDGASLPLIEALLKLQSAAIQS